MSSKLQEDNRAIMPKTVKKQYKRFISLELRNYQLLQRYGFLIYEKREMEKRR
jgi:hypothetical protein